MTIILKFWNVTELFTLKWLLFVMWFHLKKNKNKKVLGANSHPSKSAKAAILQDIVI